MAITRIGPAAQLKAKPSIPNLHQSLKPIIIIGQCFALLPVMGVASCKVSGLYFTWKSWRTIYTLFILLLGLLTTIMCLYRAVFYNFGFHKLVNFMFYGSTSMVTFLFLCLAKNWPDLMRRWNNMEVAMLKYGGQPDISLRLKIMTGIILTIALTEHILITWSTINRAFNCTLFQHMGVDEIYFVLSFPQIFAYFEYTPWKAVIFKFLNIQSTFAWNFMDLFIMLMSTAVAVRFKQINRMLRTANKHTIVAENFWKEIRQDYNNLYRLVKVLDDNLSCLVLTSFADNLYFLCVQLYNSFRPMELPDLLYFVWSTGLLISRILAVSLYGSWIYDQSRVPISLLHIIPSWLYTIEIERLVQQITSDIVALTGMKFFYLTRRLVLSIAGTIITYELVLIQFKINVIRDFDYDTNITLC